MAPAMSAQYAEARPVGERAAGRREGPRRRRHQRVLAALHHAVHQEGDHRRDQQDHRDGRAHGEVLLARDLVVDLGGHHRELAPDGLGRAEVGDDEREDHEAGAHQPELHAGQGHGQEGLEGGGPERSRRVVEARVGGGEGGDQDQERVREAVEHLRGHDALGAVDPHVVAGDAGEDPVVAEHVDEGERLHQGGREEGQHRHDAKEAAPRREGPRERVGVAEGQRHRDGHGHQRDREAVPDRGRDGGSAEIAPVVGQPHEAAGGIQQAPPDHVQQRVEHEEVEDDRERGHQRVADHVLADQPVADHAVRDHRRARHRR